MKNQAGDYLGGEKSILTKHTILLIFIQEWKSLTRIALLYLDTAMLLIKKIIIIIIMHFTAMLETKNEPSQSI